MIWTQKAQKLVESLRNPDISWELDDVCVTAGQTELRGKGSMRRINGGFQIQVRFERQLVPIDFANNQFEQMGKPRLVAKEDYWQVEAKTSDGVVFACEVAALHRWKERSDDIVEIECSASFIKLRLQMMDATDFSQMAALWKMMNDAPDAKCYELPPDERCNEPTKFHAVLPGVKSGFSNQCTEIKSVSPYYPATTLTQCDTYVDDRMDAVIALVQEGHDLHVHLDLKKVGGSPEEEDQQFEALLQAVALTHGCHPIPRLRETSRCGQVVECIIGATDDLEVSDFAAVPMDLMSLYPASRLMLGVAYDFFRSSRALAFRFKQILWLHRDAAMKAVSLPLQVLTACTLFEGLIKALFDAHKLKKPTDKSENAAEYKAAKKHAQKWLTEEHSANRFMEGEESPWSRMSGALNDFPFVRTKERVQVVAAFFGMSWEGDVQTTFDFWNAHRNPLAHGGELKQDFDSIGKMIQTWSRLSGAINRLILHEMGYKGWFVYSPMEEGLGVLQIADPSQSSSARSYPSYFFGRTVGSKASGRFYPWLWRESPLSRTMQRRVMRQCTGTKRRSLKDRWSQRKLLTAPLTAT